MLVVTFPSPDQMLLLLLTTGPWSGSPRAVIPDLAHAVRDPSSAEIGEEQPSRAYKSNALYECFLNHYFLYN